MLFYHPSASFLFDDQESFHERDVNPLVDDVTVVVVMEYRPVLLLGLAE